MGVIVSSSDLAQMNILRWAPSHLCPTKGVSSVAFDS